MESTPVGQGSNSIVPFVIGILFLLLGAWFQFSGTHLDQPVHPGGQVSYEDVSTEARRTVLGDPPKVMLNGFERECMHCHGRIDIPAGERPANKLMQHTHIKLNHGIHDGCLSCHDVKDRNKLILVNKKTVPFTEVVSLCGGCHKQVYGDWKRGSHGRSNGYWDEKQGKLNRLVCTQCHDPHRPQHPAMDSIRALPGPDTLRMPDHAKIKAHLEAESSGHELRDPLRAATLRALHHKAKTKDKQNDSHKEGAK